MPTWTRTIAGQATVVSGSSFYAADGTVSAPGMTFQNDQDLGLWRIGADSAGFVGAFRMYGPQPYVDVKARGAVGDGVADDTVAIQAAIDALPQGTRSGGIVYFPEGEYKITASLKFNHGVMLMGAGRDATIIKGALSVALLKLNSVNARHVRIIGMTIDNTSKATAGGIGIDFVNTAHSLIQDVRVRNVATGIRLGESGQAAYYNLILNPDIIDVTIGIDATSASNVTQVIGGRVDTSGGGTTGIDVQNSFGFFIYGTTLGAYTNCIRFRGSSQGCGVFGAYIENSVVSSVGISVEGTALDIVIMQPYFNLGGAGATNISRTTSNPEKIFAVGRGGANWAVDIGRGRVFEVLTATLASYDPPSLADGAQASTTVTVTGASVGDPVSVGFGQTLQGITMTGYVSAANTVTVVFQNESGGVVDLAAAAIKAIVYKI